MRRMKAALAGAVVGAVALAWAATSWACVAGVTIRVDRELASAGSEIALTIAVAGTPNPPPMAIRLDRLDAPPLLTFVPNATSPTVVRVRIPDATVNGQHILIANDEPYPLPPGKYGYLDNRALISVVDPKLAAANPAVETVIEFRSPVAFEDLRLQLAKMGAELVRMRYLGRRAGEFVNDARDPLPTAFSAFENQVGGIGNVGEPFTVDRVTVRGQVEAESLGDLAVNVARRQVVGLPSATPPLDEAQRPPVVLVASATLLLAAAASALVISRRR